MHRKNSLFLFFAFLLFFSCKNEVPVKKPKSGFIKKWFDTELIVPFSATLEIKENQTFQYHGGACTSKFNSNGTWIINKDTIILNSNLSEKCLTIIEFGPMCFDNLSQKKLAKTIKNCIPNTEEFYELFKNEKFYIRNDSLVHKNEKRENCSEFEIIFSKTKKQKT